MHGGSKVIQLRKIALSFESDWNSRYTQFEAFCKPPCKRRLAHIHEKDNFTSLDLLFSTGAALQFSFNTCSLR